MKARAEGYPISLYLDALTGSFVEEFSTSNFVGIKSPDKTGSQTYVTPSSGTILKSITNMRCVCDDGAINHNGVVWECA